MDWKTFWIFHDFMVGLVKYILITQIGLSIVIDGAIWFLLTLLRAPALALSSIASGIKIFLIFWQFIAFLGFTVGFLYFISNGEITGLAPWIIITISFLILFFASLANIAHTTMQVVFVSHKNKIEESNDFESKCAEIISYIPMVFLLITPFLYLFFVNNLQFAWQLNLNLLFAPVLLSFKNIYSIPILSSFISGFAILTVYGGLFGLLVVLFIGLIAMPFNLIFSLIGYLRNKY
jgi:hypothetical protein